MIKAVFFDMGGTLVFDKGFREKLYKNVSEVLAEELGLKIGREQFINAWLNPPWDNEDKEYWDLFRAMIFLRRIGVTPKPDLTEKVYSAVLQSYREGFYLDEEAYHVFSSLKEMGVTLGVLSNVGSYEILSERLQYLGLRRYTDIVIASQAVVWKKPDRKIFEIACYLAGVEPSEAVHVGDDPVMDIMGAKKVGMKAIQVLKGGVEKSPIADAWVKGVGETLDVISRWI